MSANPTITVSISPASASSRSRSRPSMPLFTMRTVGRRSTSATLRSLVRRAARPRRRLPREPARPSSQASSMALTTSGASCCTQCDTPGRNRIVRSATWSSVPSVVSFDSATSSRPHTSSVGVSMTGSSSLADARPATECRPVVVDHRAHGTGPERRFPVHVGDLVGKARPVDRRLRERIADRLRTSGAEQLLG